MYISGFEAEALPPVFQGIWPSLVVMIGAIITIGILWLMVSYFAYFPTKNYLDKRRAHVQSNIDNAVKMNTDAQKLMEKIEQQNKSVDAKSLILIDEAKAEALQVKNKIIEDANTQSAQIIEESRKKLEFERNQMKERITKEFVDLSIQAAEKLIKENLTNEKNEQLVKEFIQQFEQNEIN